MGRKVLRFDSFGVTEHTNTTRKTDNGFVETPPLTEELVEDVNEPFTSEMPTTNERRMSSCVPGQTSLD